MKFRIACIVSFFAASFLLFSQEVATIPQRTPEQEAANQTDRLQNELNLSAEQTKEIYEINLHYARQRQQSNSRAEATQRIHNKNQDLKRVLSSEQYDRLQNRNVNRSNYTNSNNSSSGAAMQRSTKESLDRRNMINPSTVHAESPARRQSGSGRESSIMNNRGYYNNESASSPSHSSGVRSSSSYQQRSSSSPAYNNTRSSSSSRSSGSYSAPSSGNSRSSGSSGSSNSRNSSSGSNSSNTRRR